MSRIFLNYIFYLMYTVRIPYKTRCNKVKALLTGKLYIFLVLIRKCRKSYLYSRDIDTLLFSQLAAIYYDTVYIVAFYLCYFKLYYTVIYKYP